MKKNIIITGMPRSGKSTLLKKVLSGYKEKVGFVTNEILEGGQRVGFEVETNAGEKTVLASVNFNTGFKVARYFVNIENLDRIISRVAKFEVDDLLYLDEIGQMQLFSENFRDLALKYLDASNICVATLSKVYEDDFTRQIKGRDDAVVVEITEDNRDSVEAYLKDLIDKLLEIKTYRMLVEIPKGDDRRRHLKFDRSGFVDLGPIKDQIPVNCGVMPVHYGLILGTENKTEKDEIDVVLFSDRATTVGQEIEIKPIALLVREDGDDKVVAVEVGSVINDWNEIPVKERELVLEFMGYKSPIVKIEPALETVAYIENSLRK